MMTTHKSSIDGRGGRGACSRWILRGMTVAAVSATILAAVAAQSGPVTLLAARGEVSVRRGASEQWTAAAPGDVLKPEDSIRLGAGASASLKAGGRTVALPASVIVDAADLREITRSDLLLKLAMEDVRSAPRPEPKLGEPGTARTTTTRATGRDGGSERKEGEGSADGSAKASRANALRLEGTRALFENGFYGTCALRSREIFRLEPALLARTDARIRMAEALERMSLADEAREAYAALAAAELGPAERRLVEERLEALAK